MENVFRNVLVMKKYMMVLVDAKICSKEIIEEFVFLFVEEIGIQSQINVLYVK